MSLTKSLTLETCICLFSFEKNNLFIMWRWWWGGGWWGEEGILTGAPSGLGWVDIFERAPQHCC